MAKRPRSIDEDNFRQSHVSDSDLDAMMAASFRSGVSEAPEADEMEPGTSVDGVVVGIDDDDVFVEFGKSTGVAPKEEFGGDLPEVGDKLKATFERYDTKRELGILRVSEVLREVFLNTARVGQIVEGLVDEINKGGLILNVKGTRAFMPISQISRDPVTDLAEFVGQTFQAEVTGVVHDRAEITVSRRAILEREALDDKDRTLQRLEEGQRVDGTVRRINEHGAFIDVGGADGLLHSSKLHRGLSGSELEVGQRISVVIGRLDRDAGRISLDLPEAETAGFAQAEGAYVIGESVTALVSRVRPEGAYFIMEDGIEGFVPAAELLADPVKPGQLLNASVKEFDQAKKLVVLKRES